MVFRSSGPMDYKSLEVSFHSVLNLHGLLSACVCLWDEVGNGGCICICIYIYMCVFVCEREEDVRKMRGEKWGCICFYACFCASVWFVFLFLRFLCKVPTLLHFKHLHLSALTFPHALVSVF